MKAVALLAVSFLWCAQAFPQDAPKFLVDRPPDARPDILLLGSVHLHNPGKDAMNITVDDVLAPARQAQIEALVEMLAAYKPTYVALEERAENQSKLDELYQAYRDGKRNLERREAEQIGMRLAAKMGLTRVYAVDWNGSPPGKPEAYSWSAWATANGQGERIKLLLDPSRIPYPPFESTDLATYYLAINRPEAFAHQHRIYFDIAKFGDANAQPGAEWVGGVWYARNLKIFNNILALTDNPNDRIFVVYGSGHGYHLRQFAQESGAFRLREVAEFVKPLPE